MSKGSKGGAGGQHSSEEALIATRKAKAARLRERGENPFANDIEDGDGERCDLASVRKAFDSVRGEDGRYAMEAIETKPFRVAGRILFLRSFGAMTFVRVRDYTGELQLVCDQSVLGEAYSCLDDLDLGPGRYHSVLAHDIHPAPIDLRPPGRS